MVLEPGARLHAGEAPDGDTTSVDRYYYQDGTLVAWTRSMHWRPGERGYPHRVQSWFVMANDRPMHVRALRDGRPWRIPPQTLELTVTHNAERGLREVMTRRYERERRG